MEQGKRYRARIAVGAAIIVVSVLVGFWGYAFGMGRARAMLGTSTAAVADQKAALSGNVDVILYSLIAAGIGTLIGAVILIRALLAWQRAARTRGSGD